MTTEADELAHPQDGDGFAESLTFQAADEQAGLHLLARIGLAVGRASALVLMLREGRPALAVTAGDVELADPDLRDVTAGGLRATITEPLREWTLAFEGEQGRFALRLTAVTTPIEALTAASGTTGYEQLCAVDGEVVLDGEQLALAGAGQRGHSWGVTDWDRLERVATIGAWLDGPRAALAWSARPSGAAGHGSDAVTAAVVDADGEGPFMIEVERARLSTISNPSGHQLRAGLELWPVREDDEPAWPHRAAGEAVAGATVDLGRLTLQAGFFRWRMSGHEGPGCYHMLRRS